LNRSSFVTEVPGTDVSANIRNRYAQLIEREFGVRMDLRPEDWAAAITDGEGDEVLNLRGLLAKQKVQLSDADLAALAAELKTAANAAVKIIQEGAEGQNKERQ
jgi:hypothetical protein